MARDYTPDIDAVRNAYVWAMRNAHVTSASEARAEFDRWVLGVRHNAREEGRSSALRQKPGAIIRVTEVTE